MFALPRSSPKLWLMMEAKAERVALPSPSTGQASREESDGHVPVLWSPHRGMERRQSPLLGVQQEGLIRQAGRAHREITRSIVHRLGETLDFSSESHCSAS